MLIPLIAGGVFYYLFCSEAIFVKTIDKVLPISFHYFVNMSGGMRLVRWYMPDMLWAYSFTYICWSLKSSERASVLGTVIFVICFIILGETIQMSESVVGTFDICDILLELVAAGLSIFFNEWRRINEKKN